MFEFPQVSDEATAISSTTQYEHNHSAYNHADQPTFQQVLSPEKQQQSEPSKEETLGVGDFPTIRLRATQPKRIEKIVRKLGEGGRQAWLEFLQAWHGKDG
jgi:hypothetical protein